MEEKKKMNGCLKWGLIGLGAFILLGIIGAMLDDGKNNDEGKTETTTSSELKSSTEEKSSKDVKTWEYQSKMDEMTDTENFWAILRSDNYVEQDFPYQGDTYATITIRYMKKYGNDVILSIDRGQIVGIDVNGSNYVTARFDSGEPKKYFFSDSSDGTTEQVFLNNAKDFIARCTKAKVVKVDIPMYQAGKPIFTFHVDKELEWAH